MDGPTAAAVLGVSPGATKHEIMRAYRARAKRAHPDAAGSDEAFVTLRTAFELLLDAAPAVARNRPAPWIGAGANRPTPVIDLTDTPAPATRRPIAVSPASLAPGARRFAACLDAALAARPHR